MQFAFTAIPYLCGSGADTCGWTFVSLPKDLSAEIRGHFKSMEEGWGRMQVTAKIGGSAWKTAVWFDTKQGTYLLPLKAAIRKKEKVTVNQAVEISIFI